MYMDPLYWLVGGVAMVISLVAQGLVKGAFAKYSKVPASTGLSGAQAAAEMLRREGVMDVSIERIDGWLSDHFDPSSKVIRLSPDVHDGRSLAAVGVACHEAGHALQHAQGYAWMGLRTLSVPLASLGGRFGPLLVVLGFAFQSLGMIKIGLLLFAAVFFFQLVTLPVEWNASTRAKEAVVRDGLVRDGDEAAGVASVLNAAAMTYVAAMVATLLQLLYFAFRAGLLGGGDRRND